MDSRIIPLRAFLDLHRIPTEPSARVIRIHYSGRMVLEPIGKRADGKVS